MIQNININEFRTAFHEYGGNQFSYDALGIIFEYLEQATEIPYELDVIVLCCDIAEMTDGEVRDAYNLDGGDDVIKYLEDRTSIIGRTDNKNIFVQF